jgi:hypothetical protein
VLGCNIFAHKPIADKMKNFKFLMLFWIIGVVVSCSKDDDNNIDDVTGGEIFTYQVVTVSLPDTTLSLNTYEGRLGNENVTLIRRSENTLCFSISPLAALGSADLAIPALGATIHYNIKETQLTESPDAALYGFFYQLNAYEQRVGTPEIPEMETALALVSSFNAFYEGASQEEKEITAKFYKANKQLFDEIIFFATSNAQGRASAFEQVERGIDLLATIVLGVAAGAGVLVAADYLAVAQPSAFAVLKVVGALITGVALGLAAAKIRDILVAKVTAVSVKIGGIFGQNGRGATNTALQLVNDTGFTTTLNTYRRTLNTTDLHSTNTFIFKFFNSYNTYYAVISNLNGAISYINSRLPVSVPSITVRDIPLNSEGQSEPVSQEIFNQLSLTISNPNLQLVTSSLDSNGQLTLKVKVVGDVPDGVINSTLNYSYTDNFSNFSGTLPIEVTHEEDNPLVGHWVMVSFNGGYAPGEFEPIYNIASCPGIYAFMKTYNYENFTFNADNTFTFANESVLRSLNYTMNFQSCEIQNDGSDTDEISAETDSGTYTISGNNITTVGQEGPYTDAYNFITPDKIQVGEQIYVRQ